MKSVAAAGAHPATAHEPAPGRNVDLQPALGVHVFNTVAKYHRVRRPGDLSRSQTGAPRGSGKMHPVSRGVRDTCPSPLGYSAANARPSSHRPKRFGDIRANLESDSRFARRLLPPPSFSRDFEERRLAGSHSHADKAYISTSTLPGIALLRRHPDLEITGIMPPAASWDDSRAARAPSIW